MAPGPVQPRIRERRRAVRRAARARARGWLAAMLTVLSASCMSPGPQAEPAPIVVRRPDGVRPSPAPAAHAATVDTPTARPRHASVVHAAVAQAPVPRPAAPRAETFEMTFVGDIIFGRYRADGYDPIPKGDHPVFEEISPLLRSDLVVGNLETPLVRALPQGSPIVSRYRFGADLELARHLVRGGFDAVSLANNHAYDMRRAGIEQTPEILRELGIVALGAARADASPFRVETIEREGWRVGLLAITTRSNIGSIPGLPPLPLIPTSRIEAELSPLVEDARLTHDLVVVLVHWGDEYAERPTFAQRKAAHALVEAGADMVVGHHPHVLQGIERHGHGIIAYSLGNFLFENVKEVPRQTGVLRVRYDAQGCLDAVVLHPAFVKSIPIKHPVPAVDFMGGKVKERVRMLGRSWGTRWVDDGDDLVMQGPGCPVP